MVLLVPDDVENVTNDVTPMSNEPEQPKAQLDDSEAGKAAQKVDLDLDDAPFLEDEDEEEVIDETEAEMPLFEKDDSEPKAGLLALFKNKLVLGFSAIILLLLIVIIFLVFRTPDAPPQLPIEKAPIQEEPPPVAQETSEILIKLDPFLIEQKDKTGQIRFLEVRVLVSTAEEGLARQFKQETYTVRNALYYYLKNKDLQFLSDKDNSEKLKKELLAIINQYMGFGQFDTLMFEQYLVR